MKRRASKDTTAGPASRKAGRKAQSAVSRPADPDETQPEEGEGAPGDEYFAFRSGGGGHSSGKSLREVDAFRSLDRKTLRATMTELAADDRKHADEKAALMEGYRGDFGGWLSELHAGFSLLLSGVGSKRQLLDEFCARLPKGSAVVSVRGFQPGIAINDVLDTICDLVCAAPPADDTSDASSGDDEVDDERGNAARSKRRGRRRGSSRTKDAAQQPAAPDKRTFATLHDQCVFIQQQRQRQMQQQEAASAPGAAHPLPRLYLVVHSIDGAALRSPAAQAALSDLASGVPRLHLLASCDHVNAMQLWDAAVYAKFNWAHHRTPTYVAYAAELKHEDIPLLGTASGEVAVKGLHYILKSLTPNARGLFKVLAEFQLENPSSLGLSYKQYHDKCRTKFLVSNDATMRAQMSEFREHKVILSRPGPDKVSYFYIPLEAAMLRETLSEFAS